jgi:phage N-6-adenine-methyltransferase
LRLTVAARQEAVPKLVESGMSLRDAAQFLGVSHETVRRDLSHNVTDTVTCDKRPIRGTLGTGDNEWYTPQEYLSAPRKVLGDFDLDPASNAEAQEYVKAKQFFSKDNDGLKQKWHGRVWLNPPYAQPLISRFVEKLVREFGSGNVSEAIMLTNDCTDTEWFHLAARACRAICFTRGRIKFWKPDRQEAAAPTQGQAFFYFGKQEEKFKEEFGNIGLVLRP